MTTRKTMIVTSFAVAALVLAAGVNSAQAQFCYYPAAVYAPAPVYVAPAPVYVAPAPVYVPAPVYAAPVCAPVYGPVYRPCAPVAYGRGFSFGFSYFGGGHHCHH
jgi:hypothetical protein